MPKSKTTNKKTFTPGEVQIKQITFDRAEDGKATFSTENMAKLSQYIIPIIENNKGWDTEHVNQAEFNNTPEKFRDEIDMSLEMHESAKVFVAIAGSTPLGLLTYRDHTFDNFDERTSKTLGSMTKSQSSEEWAKVKEYIQLDTSVFKKFFPKLSEFIYSKRFYTRVGITLKQDLQGIGSGVGDLLYKSMQNAFIYGRTSTPLAVAKRRQVFTETLFSPPKASEITTLGMLACLTILAARTLSAYPDSIEKNGFGITTYSDFPLRDTEKYTDLSRSLLENKKITQADYDRLSTILNIERAQGALISIN